MGQIDLRSKSVNMKSSGSIQFNSSNHSIVTGDYNVNANKSLTMSATMGSKETINGLLTFGLPSDPGIGKQVNVLGGKIEFNSVNPLGGFDVNVGPIKPITSYSMNAKGFDLFSIGKYNLDAKVGIDMTSMGPVTIVSDLPMGILLENTLGTINIQATGKISIENKIGSLGALLDELMQALAQLTVPTGTGPSGPPINAAALTAVQTKLKALLA